MSVMPILSHSQSYSNRGYAAHSSMHSSKSTPDSSPELGHAKRPKRAGLSHSASYSVTSSRPEVLELLPATTYTPPSPRGRLMSQAYVRPSLRLDPHMMPSPEEILAATHATRSRRSGSASSSSSMETVSSTRSDKRQGRLFMPTSGGLLDLLMENREMEEE